MTRRSVFIDSWAWIAAAVVTDPDHVQAVELFDQLKNDRARRFTSNFVLAETLTRLRYAVSLKAALSVAAFTAEMQERKALEVIVVGEGVWESALTWFRRFDDQTFSFVDRTSFAIMSDLAITQALTADRHFATAGFTPLGVG